MELAQLAGVNVKTIQIKKKQLDIELKNRGWGGKSHCPRPFPKVQQKKKEIKIVPPSVWRNKEWFYEMYVKQEKGIIAIAKMIDRDKNIVLHNLKRYGIKTQSDRVHKSSNPCCNREWLEEHYEIERKSVAELARMAKVNRYTICNWLVKFCIPIRDTYECREGELNPFYGKSFPHAKHKKRAAKQSAKAHDDGASKKRKRSTSSV